MKCKKNHECGIRPLYDWDCEGEPGKLIGDYCPECEDERLRKDEDN